MSNKSTQPLRNQTDAPTEVRFRVIKCATTVEPIVDWRMVPNDCLRFTSAENERAAEEVANIGSHQLNIAIHLLFV